VPEVLLSGHHAKIAAWRRDQALARTRQHRPDLLPIGVEGLVITAAQPADAGELLTLQRAAFMPEGRLNGSFEIPPLTESLADVAASLATGMVLVARLRGRLVGAVRGEERPGGRWYVGRLMVAPDLQRQGIGSVLMDAIEALAPAGTAAYALFTGAASAATLGYYRRRGYVETQRRITDDGVPVVVLERVVPAV
jgi:tRNA (guanine37-N1)-methyltransferase